MTQVIGRSELASADFIAGLAGREGAPTVVWVVDPALVAPGAGDGPLSDLAATLSQGGIASVVAATAFPREPKIPQVDALAAEIRAVANPVVVAVGGGSTMDGAKLANEDTPTTYVKHLCRKLLKVLSFIYQNSLQERTGDRD